MTDSELKKLSRQQLIELLLEQSKRVEELQQKADRLSKKLADKTIRLEQAGSIAQAALQLNHIFEDAQAAAQQYLDSIQALSETKAFELEQKERELRKLTETTRRQCRLMEEQTKQQCEERLQQAGLASDGEEAHE